MPMTKERAIEHIRDGADCISECLKSIERVRKNFPNVASRISATTVSLQSSRRELEDLRAEFAGSTEPKVATADQKSCRLSA